MAGQFFLYDIDTNVLNQIVEKLDAKFDTVEHCPDPGWNAQTRAVIADVRDGNPPANRHLLPPHKYLEIEKLSDEQLQYLYSSDATDWINELERPNNISKGLRGGKELWEKGASKRDTLIAEVRSCPVSIEVYYIDSREIPCP
jgi:hypothetical protein